MRSLTIQEREICFEIYLMGEVLELEYYLFDNMPSVKCEMMIEAHRRKKPKEAIYQITVKANEEHRLMEILKKYCEEEDLTFLDADAPAISDS